MPTHDSGQSRPQKQHDEVEWRHLAGGATSDQAHPEQQDPVSRSGSQYQLHYGTTSSDQLTVSVPSLT